LFQNITVPSARTARAIMTGRRSTGKYGHGAASIFGSRFEVNGSVTTSFWRLRTMAVSPS
jgi:hypothetical protein